ncbi:hybrid sensor histidine kinase/response regulator [Euhalothece natronophila]|uniref:hybrid sensor histidine kinase/response regulator n=1 Tax=Euhalothece natronophila TaxID=577489 RepID=UPI001FEB40C2|nr:hybrid sensor histidine kinase/response regulator [Euhalothece natronophila]
MQRGLRELLNRFSRFQGLVGRLQEFSDQEIIRQGNQQQGNLQPTAREKQETSTPDLTEQPESVLDLDFDSLELDQYGALNATLQELLEETAQIEESVGDISLFAEQSDQTLQGQRKMLEQLRDELIWARMLPLSNILDRFPRILRDFSYQYEKPTQLRLEGTGVRVDKSVLEKLYDPLTHLVRNAFDHGIESPEKRREAGKPEEGEIAIRAYYQGNQTVIEIGDDGGGINLERVKEKAINTGLITPDQAENRSSERLYNFLFEPGFSTAKEVSDLSGRGVGLDVVRDQIRELKGAISLRSQPGKGTTFVLSLPTTQSMAKLLIVLVDTTVWALPSDNIEQILVPTSDQVKYTGEQRFLQWNDQALPIYAISDLLDYNCPVPAASPNLQPLGAVERPQERGFPLIILRRGQQQFPLELNRVITEQELVIKSFGSAIAPPQYVSGCTILGDGTIVPVLDAFNLLESVQQTQASAVVNTTTRRSLTSEVPTILVVDDSATQRQTLTFSLQRAGYQVLQAGDGREAISVLQRHPDTNVVICDIEMPNMNGFEFLRYRRQDETLNQVPVVMLTSRSSEKHRKLCQHLGASEYFTKPYLEKEFINTLQEVMNY